MYLSFQLGQKFLEQSFCTTSSHKNKVKAAGSIILEVGSLKIKLSASLCFKLADEFP